MSFIFNYRIIAVYCNQLWHLIGYYLYAQNNLDFIVDDSVGMEK